MQRFAETAIFRSWRHWIELAALGSLASTFAVIPIYAPQGIDIFAVAFFCFGSLLIDKRDMLAADWWWQRPFVFGCAVLILAIPLVSGACSVNGFKAQVGSGVYVAAAPPALFLVASRARFHLIGQRGIKRLILAGIFLGLIPAVAYSLATTLTTREPFVRFDLPAQAANIEAVYLSCMSAITLSFTIDLDRRARFLGYLAVLALTALGLLTASRTILLSTTVAFAVYALAIRHRSARLRELSAVVVMIVALVSASFFAFRSGLARLFEPSELGFFNGRLQTWADGWELFRRYPLCGIGHGIFYDRALNPLYLERDRQGMDYIPFYHAHNIYLNTLAEGGIFMGVLLAVFIAAAAYGCYRVLSADPRNRYGLIAATLLALFLVVGLFENTMVRPVIFPLAIFLGLAMNVTWRRPLREAREPAPNPLSGAPVGAGDTRQ